MIEDGVKISELTEASTINDSDLIPIVQSDETKQISKSQLTRHINNYSGAETICGEWFDGKPLYRKVYVSSNVNFGDWTTFPLDSTYVVKRLEGYLHRTGNKVDPFTGGVNTSQALLIYSIRTAGIEMWISNAYQGEFENVCFIIEYTKTTD